MSGRVLHANLHLMDRQLVDVAGGKLLGKVDDLVIDVTHDPPVVTAILSGPQAWGPRLPGLIGRLVTSVHRRLSPEPDPGPTVIPFARVVDIGSAVKVTGGPEVAARGFAEWLDDQVITRIPGAGDAPE